MNNKNVKVSKAYKSSKQIYDDVLTARGFWSGVYNKIVWGMKDEDYVGELLSFIPDDFKGNMLDVPVGNTIK